MKGKGKSTGDKGGKSGGSNADSSGGNDAKDNTIQFPDVKPVDHTRLCPRYTAGMCVNVISQCLYEMSQCFPR